jgi:putative membrane protein
MTPSADGGHHVGAGASMLAAVPFLAVLVAGYAYAAVLAGRPGAAPRRVVSWYAGLGVVAVAVAPPLGGSHAVSAHMVQHELLLAVAPLLLVAGLDRRVTRALAVPALRAVPGLRVLLPLRGPLFATGLWVAVVLGWHLPAVYDATLDDARLHLLRQATLVVAGVVFWGAVLGRRGAVEQRIAALGVAMAASGVLGAALLWSDAVLYRADPWPGLSPVADQRLAGLLMMALDMPVLLAALGAVVARWARRQPSLGEAAPWPST